MLNGASPIKFNQGYWLVKKVLAFCKSKLYFSIPFNLFAFGGFKPTFIMNAEILKHIHWLAVLVASVAYFVLGALWYSKILFVQKWLALLKIDSSNPDATKGVAAIMVTSFVTILVGCTGLGILVAYLHLSGFSQGFKLGTLTGICFGITAISNSYLYERKPLGLHLINGGYVLVGNIIAAVILCVW